jgi:hypothetical protein
MSHLIRFKLAHVQGRIVLGPRLRWLAIGLVSVSSLGGCTVVSAAATVASAAVSVTATVVTTGVKVVGAAVEKTVDVVAGDSSYTPAAVEPAASVAH